MNLFGGSWQEGIILLKHKVKSLGTWVTQSVKRPTSAQVMILQFLGLSPALGSVLTAQTEPGACFTFCLPLCHSPTHTLYLSLSLSKINEH